MPELKNVVIVGAGPFTGIALANSLAKSLPSTHRVVLIDRNPFAWFTFVAARGSVVPGWEDKTIVPLDQVFAPSSRHTTVQAEVVDFDNSSVTLKSAAPGFGSKIAADAVLLATASTYSFPANSAHSTFQESKQQLVDFQNKVKAARSILVVGSGPYGLEFAGEVADLYKGADKKEITLVGSTPYLIGEPFSKKFGDNLQKQLESRGVKVILEDRVDVQGIESGPIEPTTFTSRNVKADFVLVAVGNKPQTQWIASRQSELVRSDGRLKTRPTLQLEKYDHVFATGDLAGLDLVRSGVNAMSINSTVTKNTLALIKGAALSDFKPSASQALAVSVGTTGGAIALPFGGFVMPAFLTKRIKSQGLFADQNLKNYRGLIV